MNFDFDDLAHAVASGLTRRQVLKRVGIGIAGALVSTLGFRNALAAVTCGKCEACDLDTSTCGLPCSGSAAQSICTQASKDGSYIRLANYLGRNGYSSTGSSSPVISYKSGKLFASGLSSAFTNAGAATKSATIFYTVNANGDIFPFTVLANNGEPTSILNIDPSGRVQEMVLTQQITSVASAIEGSSNALGASDVGHQKKLAPRFNAGADAQPVVIPDITLQSICTAAVAGVCNYAASFLKCELVGTAVCAALSGPEGEAPFPFCEAIITFLCSKGTAAACTAAGAKFCSCAPNQSCSDPAYPGGCCPPCNNCVNGTKCMLDSSCSDPNATCCVNMCCADGYTCIDGVCTSPDSGCVGADCATYSSCNNNSDCFCGTLAEGGGLCQVSVYCDGLALCPDGECADGSFCLIGSCCGEPVCVPNSAICPAEGSVAASKHRPALQGRTTGPRR